MGRPSKFDPKVNYEKLSDEYIASCGREQTKLPTLSEFARSIGITDDTLENWAEEKPDLFGTIKKKIKDVQKEQLINDGIYGGKEVNATMCIFLLKTNHGMIETERKELVGEDGGPIKVFINPRDGFVPASGQSSVEGQS